jgi:hypothetical protein
MNRRGIALVLVLLAVLVTAALAAGVLVAASTQARASGDAMLSLRTTEAAENGQVAAAAGWSRDSNLTMLDGATAGPFVTRYPDSTSSVAFVTRLSRTTYWISARGRSRATGGTLPVESRVGALYTLHVPEPRLAATISVRDSFSITGAARVDGNDTPPPVWGSLCAVLKPPIAAVAAPDTTRVCDGPCSSTGSRLTGTPPKHVDSLAGSPASLNQLGAVTWTSLAAHASNVLTATAIVTPAPRLTSGPGAAQCDTAAADNWGDPSRATPCANRFVIVHALGDLIMDGGAGQGIILGEGDVELRNGAQFFGLVLTRDDVIASIGNNRVWGAVVAGDMRRAMSAGPGDLTAIAGGTQIVYSSCALETALVGTAPLRREAKRSWARLY